MFFANLNDKEKQLIFTFKARTGNYLTLSLEIKYY